MELIAASLAALPAGPRRGCCEKIYTDKKIGTRIIAVNTRAFSRTPA